MSMAGAFQYLTIPLGCPFHLSANPGDFEDSPCLFTRPIYGRLDPTESGGSTVEPEPSEASSSGGDPELEAASPFGPSQPTERDSLVELVFSLVNLKGDGWIDCAELQPFAKLHGFKGSLHEWQQEFEELCEQSGRRSEPGLDPAAFRWLVDENEHFRLTNDRLKRVPVLLDCLRESEAQPSQSPFEAPETQHQAGSSSSSSGPASSSAAASGARTQPSMPSIPEATSSGRDAESEETQSGPSQPTERDSLAELVFSLLNLKGDGWIDCNELQPFAKLHGFQGSNRDWKEEFEMLSKACGLINKPGLDRAAFRSLIDENEHVKVSNARLKNIPRLLECLREYQEVQPCHTPAATSERNHQASSSSSSSQPAASAAASSRAPQQPSCKGSPPQAGDPPPPSTPPPARRSFIPRRFSLDMLHVT